MTPYYDRAIEALSVAIVGMGTVFLSLWVIGEVFAFLRWCFHRKAPPAPAGPPAAPADPTDPSGAQLVTVLAAAATVAAGRRVAVRRITFITPDTVSGWAGAGRGAIQTSHNLRRGY